MLFDQHELATLRIGTLNGENHSRESWFVNLANRPRKLPGVESRTTPH
jgi:hypothetical protein